MLQLISVIRIFVIKKKKEFLLYGLGFPCRTLTIYSIYSTNTYLLSTYLAPGSEAEY